MLFRSVAVVSLLPLYITLSACSQKEGLVPGIHQETKDYVSGRKHPTDDSRLNKAATDLDNWLTHGRDYAEQRFSPLDQINLQNIEHLNLAWHFDLDTSRGQEATPLVVDGILYSSSSWSKVQAVDARTGDLIWQFDPQVPKEVLVKACCGPVNRGVAFYQGKVYIGALDGRLIAIDAKSGEKLWETMTVDPAQSYTITGAPRVAKGKVFIGNGGGEYGVRGYISAYDTETGKFVWRFYTVPGNPENPVENSILKTAAETWSGNYWELGGGGTVWDSMAYDPELDLLYFGVGNGSPWNAELRSPGGGDNLFLSSIVAVRPDTGEYVWHYQTTPGDSWDYTATQHMILADMEIDGQQRNVIMQAPKNGFFYVLDRATGELISAEPYVPVNWATGIDESTGRPQIVEDAHFSRTGKAWLGLPGFLGGHNWHPMAYSQHTGLVYIPAQEIASPYIADNNHDNYELSKLSVNLGLDHSELALPENPEEIKIIKDSQRGRLLAWDPREQREVWRVEHAGPWNGGVLATGGNLIFHGQASGQFSAYRDDTGEQVWAFDAQTGIVAPPITYRVDGVQYITVVAGWGGIYPLLLGELSDKSGKVENISRILTFRLDGKDQLPAINRPTITLAPILTDETLPEDQVKQGKPLYQRYCSGCHGDSAISGGLLPDLRYSPLVASEQAWFQVLLEGALQSRGMVSYAEELSAEDARALRIYVLHRARQAALQ